MALAVGSALVMLKALGPEVQKAMPAVRPKAMRIPRRARTGVEQSTAHPASVGSRDAKKALLTKMDDATASVASRVKALLELAAFGMPSTARPKLMRLARTGPRQMRVYATMLLATIPSQGTASTLMAALDDRDHVVRMNAVHGLGLLRHRPAVPRLLSMLTDEHEHVDVRAEVAEALVSLPSSRVIRTLMEMTQDDEVSVRYFAVRSLGQLRSREAIPLLRSLAGKDPASTSFGSIDDAIREALQLATSRPRKYLRSR